MNEFEVIAITLSFIIGFAITQILTGIVDLVRSPTPVKWDWMPLCWAWTIFVSCVQFWFGILWASDTTGLGGAIYAAFLSLAIFLFLASGLILPSQSTGLQARLIDDFDKKGRWALIPVIGAMIIAVTVNVSGGLPPQHIENLSLFAMLACVLVVFLVRIRLVQRIGTLAVVGIQLYGVIFLFSRPGSI